MMAVLIYILSLWLAFAPQQKAQIQIPVTISASLLDGTTDWTNYPLYIPLSTLGDPFWNRVRSDGGDIRVFTSASPATDTIPAHVLDFDKGNKKGVLFTRITLDADADMTIYVRAGNPSATTLPADNANGQYATWASLYQGWSPTILTNSTTVPSLNNAQTLTTGTYNYSGQSGKLEHTVGEFLGAASAAYYYAAVGGVQVNYKANMTYVGWSLYTTLPSYITMVGHSSINTNNQWLWRMQSSNTIYVKTTVANNALTGGWTGSNNVWRHWAFSNNNGTVIVYNNGSAQSMSDGTTHASVDPVASASFYLGMQYNGATCYLKLDMQFIFNSTLSADQILALYRNQNAPATYLTVGATKWISTTPQIF